MEKSDRNEYAKAYYAANKEKIKAQSKAWSEANVEKLKQWRQDNREQLNEKARARHKAWRKANLELDRERRKRNRFKYNYGITIEDYNQMLVKQDGKCAICREFPTGEGKESKLHVDHDHKTGKVRGLLCTSCNMSLGLLKENTSTLSSAIQYLLSGGPSASI